MRIVLFFIDGLGIGEPNNRYNPFLYTYLPNIEKAISMGACIPTDTRLGVPGLPQSATGQTAMLTGINASKKIGRHISGYPTPSLMAIINEYSIFKQLKQKGFKCINANMFTGKYIDQINNRRNSRLRISATTAATLAADLPFCTQEDLLRGKAVYHDITNESLAEKSFQIPIRTPDMAGSILADLSHEYDFTFFEYFQTDEAGHRQEMNRCMDVIHILDQMIGALTDNIELDEVLLIITSDHGNIEDLSVKTHTLNKVPTLLVGARSHEFSKEITSILDITPTIIKAMTKGSH